MVGRAYHLAIAPRKRRRACRAGALGDILGSPGWLTTPRSVSDTTVTSNDVPQPGDVLAGKYRVESVLGVGGMGVVLLVEHIELGQKMAIKLMTPGVIPDEQAVARFLREARSAAALQSEHVVRIFDVGTLESGAPYMVMELLRGEDLGQVLLNVGRLEISDAVDYVLQACHAIAEAHAKGMVHRDLKPSNLSSRGEATELHWSRFSTSDLQGDGWRAPVGSLPT